ncbi:MAG TPA: dihydrolipoamide acetyltransferase family protein [Gemmatimonadaceae bacterium]|nr:dihydrolipoamide acetyltransferase family protein [Gemmatimonadaceae bacterium]
MEALSPTMEEGRLVKWLKNEGDPVKSGETLAEVETDKAVMELVARGEGVLRKRIAAEGETAPVGTLLAVIAAPDEDITGIVPGAATPPETSVTGGAKPPSQVIAGTQETAGASPVPRTPQQSQGEASTPPQEKVAAAPAGAQAQRPPRPEPPTEQAPHAGDGGRLRSSPLARRLASERGLELDQLRGTGPGGRIVKRDIEAAVQAGTAAAPAARVERAGDFEDVALTQIRKTIARRLTESIGPIPTFYLTAEYDLAHVTELRAAMAQMGDEFKVSVNDIVLKAVATALSQHPEVNAHWLGDKIRYWNRVHLGMAVATDDGLIVPVIFDADTKRLSEIAREAKELAKRARERKLRPEEFTGSTFSVSNLGMFGIDQFTAIINPPEAGILAIGTAEDKVVVEDGEMVVRKRMRVTMSCDHRVIDGAVGAKFLQTLRRMIENPLMLVY